jgi:hypothetical protein
VTKINNVIKLNGVSYDSRTGQSFETKASPAIKVSPSQGRRLKTVDGFLLNTVPGSQTGYKSITPVIPVQPVPASHGTDPKIKHNINLVIPHQPERSKTLMRHSVKIPTVKSATIRQKQAPTDVVRHEPQVLDMKPKLSSDNVDADRANRARDVPRSNQVARFRRQINELPQTSTVTAAQLPERLEVPLKSQVEPEKYHPDMFEKAIESATSHVQPEAKLALKSKARHSVKHHARIFGISAIVVAALLLGSFIAYQNKIELELQLASAKAGFPASMPGFQPAGYVASKLNYDTGRVTIGYSGPNNRNYFVTQKLSNWDSETLLQNYVATSGQPYNAYQAAGRTVFIYGNGNATWVSGGIWYSVVDNGTLNKGQIIELANSM